VAPALVPLQPMKPLQLPPIYRIRALALGPQELAPFLQIRIEPKGGCPGF
jgi:hypothetical protein